MEAASIPVVIFNPDAVADEVGQMATLDLNMYLTGGIAEGRQFRIVYTTGFVTSQAATTATSANFKLTGPMLELMVADEFTPAADPHAQDAVILIEATDPAIYDAEGALVKRAESAVLYVKVRGNVEPAPPGASTSNLIIGTQSAATEDYTTQDADDVWDISCTMLNTCEIDVTSLFTDANLQDSLTYRAFSTDPTKVSAVPTATGATLKGLVGTTAEGTNTPVIVYVWAVDERCADEVGCLPKNNEENDDTTAWDDTEHPLNDKALVLTVTVDAQPEMSTDAIENLTVDVGDDELVGTVFDLEDETVTIEYAEADDHNSNIATVAYVNDAGDTGNNDQATLAGDSQDGVRIQVSSHNSGTTTFMLELTEAVVADDNAPRQYAEHMFTVTVQQQ